ncbi:hypothetical protein SKAU_G00147720 [Synaphobranchus kaupii]|uniref:Uncharacterized protein n=1 Tax=Synaphobranchus kaupii TaxID=118154 RepID=A0A9Q1FU77_SYNKA|nr:hypothetical protein SKAU_G00147720 [Synaphobranchus kaupii]
MATRRLRRDESQSRQTAVKNLLGSHGCQLPPGTDGTGRTDARARRAGMICLCNLKTWQASAGRTEGTLKKRSGWSPGGVWRSFVSSVKECERLRGPFGVEHKGPLQPSLGKMGPPLA